MAAGNGAAGYGSPGTASSWSDRVLQPLLHLAFCSHVSQVALMATAIPATDTIHGLFIMEQQTQTASGHSKQIRHDNRTGRARTYTPQVAFIPWRSKPRSTLVDAAPDTSCSLQDQVEHTHKQQNSTPRTATTASCRSQQQGAAAHMAPANPTT